MTQNSTEYQESINYSEYLPKYPGSPIEFPGYIFIPENNNYTEFDLFTTFLVTCEPQTLNVDNFARSIRNKAVAVKLAYNEVLKQVPNWIKENEAANHFGFTIDAQGVLLAIKYEVYLNSIYSLCGNCSFPSSDPPKPYSNACSGTSFTYQVSAIRTSFSYQAPVIRTSFSLRGL